MLTRYWVMKKKERNMTIIECLLQAKIILDHNLNLAKIILLPIGNNNTNRKEAANKVGKIRKNRRRSSMSAGGKQIKNGKKSRVARVHLVRLIKPR